MKRHTPLEWAEIFGIEIIDNDGWRGDNADFYAPTTLADFCHRINESTININNYTKYRAFSEIIS